MVAASFAKILVGAALFTPFCFLFLVGFTSSLHREIDRHAAKVIAAHTFAAAILFVIICLLFRHPAQ